MRDDLIFIKRDENNKRRYADFEEVADDFLLHKKWVYVDWNKAADEMWSTNQINNKLREIVDDKRKDLTDDEKIMGNYYFDLSVCSGCLSGGISTYNDKTHICERDD